MTRLHVARIAADHFPAVRSFYVKLDEMVEDAGIDLSTATVESVTAALAELNTECVQFFRLNPSEQANKAWA